MELSENKNEATPQVIIAVVPEFIHQSESHGETFTWHRVWDILKLLEAENAGLIGHASGEGSIRVRDGQKFRVMASSLLERETG